MVEIILKARAASPETTVLHREKSQIIFSGENGKIITHWRIAVKKLNAGRRGKEIFGLKTYVTQANESLAYHGTSTSCTAAGRKHIAVFNEISEWKTNEEKKENRFLSVTYLILRSDYHALSVNLNLESHLILLEKKSNKKIFMMCSS